MSAATSWSLPDGTIENDLFIGRDGLQAAVILDHSQVSRRHARLSNDQGRIYLSDCDSANGTYVNGRRVLLPTPLNFGDRIGIGPFELIFDGQSIRLDSPDNIPAAVVARELSRVSIEGSYIVQPLALTIPRGDFVAIIGPSGSGKSTLIDLLSGRIPLSTGQVQIVGRDISVHSIRSTTVACVPQLDSFLDVLKLQKSLICTARLRLPPDQTRAEISRATDHILQLVGLSHRGTTQIARLSGGQRRRLSLAQELLSDPEILVLDEVTSGLDEQSDEEIMQLLATIAASGKTILCVTHNLAHIQSTCSRVIVMGHHGKLEFIGTPAEVCSHFGVSNIESVLSALGPAVTAPLRKEIARSNGDYQSPASAGSAASNSAKLLEGFQQGRFKWQQLFVLLHRQYLQILANPENQILSLVVMGVICLLLNLRFDNLSDPGPQARADVIAKIQMQSSSLIIFLAVASFFLGCFTSSRELVTERRFFWREAGAGLSPVMYLLSKFVVLGSIASIQAFILGYLVTTYLELAVEGHVMAAICGITALTGTAVGLLMSAAASREEQVNSVLTLVTIPQIVLSQALTPLRDGLKRFSEQMIITFWSHRSAESSLPSYLRVAGSSASDDWNRFLLMSALHIGAFLAITWYFLIRTARGEDPAKR